MDLCRVSIRLGLGEVRLVSTRLGLGEVGRYVEEIRRPLIGTTAMLLPVVGEWVDGDLYYCILSLKVVCNCKPRHYRNVITIVSMN